MSDDTMTPSPISQSPTHRRPRRIGLAAIAGALILGLSTLTYAAQADTQQTTTATSPVHTELRQQGWSVLPSESAPPSSEPGTPTLAATDATAAQESGLVYINTTLDYGAGKAAGTGMILTAEGEILTNHHVVEDATEISVQVVSTGRTYEADVVGFDATHDVAVLHLLDASGLTTVTTDSAGDVQVGDEVVGVGNANGDGGAASAAAGTVSALDQSITVQSQSGGNAARLSGLIEVSAEIISGDSGGALYDAEGEVIGMNTAASSGTVDVTGYAVPIRQALTIAEQIQSGRTSPTVQIGATGFLGVQLVPDSSGVSGARVAGVIAGTAAASAGIEQGSAITAVDGTRVDSQAQLSAAVSALQPGSSTTVSWTDADGGSHSATVTLTAGPIG
ncbi:S1C family serine protease [Aeromicrobium sp. A1-2]|uniref:S1C family serine protease n=1 Tax=Aeromicrobium sp. A1-2 TaxID=2107713 RepID=UPI0013C2B09D|nr:trypsin-like peptidase domain-containing protein [Aeromicrobium sp. A1-2]